MAETLFISDLHLDPERPRVIDLLERFLEARATRAEALYILGDLFEYWIGDDAIRPGLEPVIAGLRHLTDQGISSYFMAGNRDFLVGEAFASATGCQRLEEPALIDLYGTPTLLMHGDTLCTDDVAYQHLRTQLRNPTFQAGFLALPIEQRRQQAEALRRESREATQGKSPEIMDVNLQAVLKTFRTYPVSQLIHGHTHRPAVHALNVDGRPVRRIVLGDWYTQGSVLSVTPEGIALESLRTD